MPDERAPVDLSDKIMQCSDQVCDFKERCAVHVPEKLCGQMQSPTGMHDDTCMGLHMHAVRRPGNLV